MIRAFIKNINEVEAQYMAPWLESNLGEGLPRGQGSTGGDWMMMVRQEKSRNPVAALPPPFYWPSNPLLERQEANGL